MANQPSFSVFRLSDISVDDYSALLKRTEDDLDFFLERVPEIIEARLYMLPAPCKSRKEKRF